MVWYIALLFHNHNHHSPLYYSANMSYLSESWLQEISTKNLGLGAVSIEVVEEILPFVELQVRRVVQQALKFQRRSKSAYLKGIRMMSF